MRKQGIRFFTQVAIVALFSATSLTKIVSVNAEPASIFKAIIRDIQNQLPKEMVMRLPSRVNISDTPFYPEVVTTIPGEFAVFLNTQPNCGARACQLGILTVAKESEYANSLRSRPIFSKTDMERVRQIQQQNSQTWTAADKQLLGVSKMAVLERIPITLKPGIEGLFIVQNGGGASTPPSLSVVWRQDGLNYRVSVKGGVDRNGNVILSQKSEIITLAISMAKETPIQPRLKR